MPLASFIPPETLWRSRDRPHDLEDEGQEAEDSDDNGEYDDNEYIFARKWPGLKRL
jgi:hypothetical protein